MTWEQRFGALTGLDSDEWDVAYERLELEWRSAYTAAFVEIAVARGWRRDVADRNWRRGIHRSLPLRLGPEAGGRSGRRRL